MNQIIEYMLHAYVAKKSIKWELCLPLLEFAYNISKHTLIIYMYYFVLMHAPIFMLIQHYLKRVEMFLKDMQELL